jgi:hypothetical protein
MPCKERNKWVSFQFIPSIIFLSFYNSSLLKKETKNMMKDEGRKKHGWTKDSRSTAAFIRHSLKSYSQLNHVSLVEVWLPHPRALYKQAWHAEICIVVHRKGALKNIVRISHRQVLFCCWRKWNYRYSEDFCNKFFDQRNRCEIWPWNMIYVNIGGLEDYTSSFFMVREKAWDSHDRNYEDSFL